MILKNSLLLIASGIITAISFAQIQSDCKTRSELEYFYKKDVADLAINRLFAINSADTNKIEIPQIYMDSIWNGLSAIFNAFSIPERDSIFDIYCIHNYSHHTKMLLPQIYIVLDTSVHWTSNWLNGEIVTGYAELDEFISNYKYSIYSISPTYSSVALYSDSIINSFAVGDSLIAFVGIHSAEPYHTTVDGDKIQYFVEGNNQYFNFSLAWGDCMSGCIYNRTWNFKVHYSQCTVEYMGVDPNATENLPIPGYCNITSIKDHDHILNDISIFPNPTKDKVLVKGEGIQHIELLNTIGQSITSIKPESILSVINIIDLKPGLYFIKFDIDGQSIIRKFIKN